MPFQREQTTISMNRVKALTRTMDATTTYLKTILQLEPKQLYYLGLQAWGGWFYSLLVMCKVIFLEDNERIGNTVMDDLTHEISGIFPENTDSAEPTNDNLRQSRRVAESGWQPVSVARDYNVQNLFDQYKEMFLFTLPPNLAPWTLDKSQRDSLHTLACLLHVMRAGFMKRIQRVDPTANIEASANVQPQNSRTAFPTSVPPNNSNPLGPGQHRNLPSYGDEHPTVQSSLPFLSTMNFDSINFDGLVIPGSVQQQQPNIMDDWIWNSMMDDFTLPTL